MRHHMRWPPSLSCPSAPALSQPGVGRCYVSDGCTAQNTSGSFKRKYAECLPLEDLEFGPDGDHRPAWANPSDEAASGDDEHNRYWDYPPGTEYPPGQPGPDGDDSFYAWDNVSTAWDETANFTGLDEYWAGTSAGWDEGEDRPWWTENGADEGDDYGWAWPEDLNYTGCNCPAFCVSNGWVFMGDDLDEAQPGTTVLNGTSTATTAAASGTAASPTATPSITTAAAATTVPVASASATVPVPVTTVAAVAPSAAATPPQPAQAFSG